MKLGRGPSGRGAPGAHTPSPLAAAASARRTAAVAPLLVRPTRRPPALVVLLSDIALARSALVFLSTLARPTFASASTFPGVTCAWL